MCGLGHDPALWLAQQGEVGQEPSLLGGLCGQEQWGVGHCFAVLLADVARYPMRLPVLCLAVPAKPLRYPVMPKQEVSTIQYPPLLLVLCVGIYFEDQMNSSSGEEARLYSNRLAFITLQLDFHQTW